ncbi:hypothetical protein M3Y97_00682900 [Aphelenchoides bicaudatus]|nr:hypothetical protein M3Y97_00682900 [Aphelenchoides bicaudatus]
MKFRSLALSLRVFTLKRTAAANSNPNETICKEVGQIFMLGCTFCLFLGKEQFASTFMYVICGYNNVEDIRLCFFEFIRHNLAAFPLRRRKGPNIPKIQHNKCNTTNEQSNTNKTAFLGRKQFLSILLIKRNAICFVYFMELDHCSLSLLCSKNAFNCKTYVDRLKFDFRCAHCD